MMRTLFALLLALTAVQLHAVEPEKDPPVETPKRKEETRASKDSKSQVCLSFHFPQMMDLDTVFAPTAHTTKRVMLPSSSRLSHSITKRLAAMNTTKCLSML